MPFARFIIRFRIAVIIIITLITIIMSVCSFQLRIESDILNSLPPDDRYVKLFNYIGEQYNGNHIALVIIEDDIFSNNVIDKMIMLTDSLEILDFGSIISLMTLTDIRDNNGIIEISPLIDRELLPFSDSALEPTSCIRPFSQSWSDTRQDRPRSV